MRLVKSVAADGVRKFLPAIGKTVCPICQRAITADPHWSEVIVGIVAAIPVLLLFHVDLFQNHKKEAIIGIVIWFAIVTGIITWSHFRYLRSWQRYRAP
ncbi:MAG: hypothetical protein EAZ21_03015 [Betaproteobacteria bacterium]|nr:MAG: hypothetical protein EAZ21_03015 [Betaproteobacteria bacterium]